MKTRIRSNNFIMEVALETGTDLKFDKVTMRQLEALAMPVVKVLTPRQIRRLRTRAGVSQNVMALYLNVSPSIWQKWERGEITPTGGNLTLLNVAYKKGPEALA